jgi:hypothetical protein
MKSTLVSVIQREGVIMSIDMIASAARVCGDVRCPWCWNGLRRLYDDEHGVRNALAAGTFGGEGDAAHREAVARGIRAVPDGSPRRSDAVGHRTDRADPSAPAAGGTGPVNGVSRAAASDRFGTAEVLAPGHGSSAESAS